MVKKDDIIKDFQDAVQGVTRNGDECIVLYFDKSTTELRHFGTSHGQHFLQRHEEFIHQFMAFCSGTEKLEGCLNVTDAALSGPNTGNVQIVSGKEVNPENEPYPSVIDKGKSSGQNTLNSSQEKSNLNQSGTNLIFAGNYRRTGAIQTVVCGKQTGFSPEGKQPDPIVIKDDPDPVLNDLDSVLNDSDPVLNESDSLLNNPDSVLNDPDSALNDPDSVLNDPDSALNDQDSVLNVPDPVQNDQDPMLNYPNPGINDPDLVKIDLDLTQNQSMVIKSDPDSVKSEIHSIKNDQDSVESNLPVAPKKVEQNDIQNASNPVNISGDSVQNEPIPVQRDPDPVQNKPDPLLWDQIYLPNRKNPAKKKMFVVLRHKSKPFSTVIPVLNPNSALLNPMLNPRTVPNLKPNSVTVPNRSQNLVTVLNLTPNVVTLPNLKPKPVVVPNLKPNSATEPNLTTNSPTVSNLTPKPATVPNLTPNSVVAPNVTPYSATVPNLTPNLATVPNLKTNSVVVPDLATNSAAVPNLTPHSESVSNRTPYLVTLLNRTPNSATVPNLTPTSATVPNLTSYSETVPNLTSYSETVPNLTYNLATVPNLTSNLATAPNLTSNLANDLAIKGKPVDQKQGHVEKLREHTSKADMVQCEEHLDQSQEHMSKVGEHIRHLYSEEVKFLPSTVDIDLECIEVKVNCEDDMEQCEEHLDQSQEHMEQLNQGQEHMELSREQGQEHMEQSGEQGQDLIELSTEQGQEHREHKYGEHSGFDSYVDSIWMKPKPNPYHVDHPYAKKSEKQMKIPREQLDVTNKSGEHIGTTGERIKTEDCDMSLLMEVNEIDETMDQKDSKKEKYQTQRITFGADKTSSAVRKREGRKPRKLVAEKKGLTKEKRFSLMKVSYEANYDMPDGATLTCLQCNQNFEDLKDLQFHLLKTKHEQVSATETAFKCFTCLRYFQREWDLQQHMISTRHNGNVKKARKSLYNTKNRVEKVIWTDGSKTYRCFKCNNTYKDFFSAKSHVMRDQCLSKYSIPCQVCDKFFTDKNSHQVHVRTAHKEEFPFRCKNCDKIFYRKNRYARHKEHCIQGIEEIGRSRKVVETCESDSESLDVEQICIICRETFINYDQLKAHIVQSGHEQVTTTETINKCFTCNTYFQKYVDLTYHMSLTSHTGNPRLSRKRWVMKSHGAFSCSFCREIFPSVEKCEEHVKEKTCTERWSKKCLFCPKTYFQKNIYEVHIKSEHDYQRPLKCFKCGQEYKQLSAFLEHQEECNHGNDKLPKKEGEIKRENYCAICDRTFNSSIVLKLHKWRVHKESMFKCEICKCKFKRLNQLLFHLKMNKHSSSVSMVRKKKTAANKKSPTSSSMAKTNVKDTTKLFNECNVLQKKSKDGQTLYTCEICSRSFGKLDNLTRHQRTNHFRPKSLLCEYCGYETMWISNFRLHVKSVHNMDYDTSLCNICGEEMSKSLLKKHMATHVETQTTQTHVKTQGAAGTRVKTAQLSGKDRRAGKSKEPNVFKCNLCINATFDKNYKYEMHMLRHYGEEGKLPCVMCDSKVAGYTEGMLKHLRRVHHLSYDEAFAIRGNVEPLTLRLGKLMEKYSEKGPPVPDLDYFPSK